MQLLEFDFGGAMSCNGYNHYPNCPCGFRGQYRGSFGAARPGGTPLFASSDYISPELGGSFCTPNATCPVCGARVFFYSNSFGSRVFFDDLGPPWPKHPCTDRTHVDSDFLEGVKRAEIRKRYGNYNNERTPREREDWKQFSIIPSRSFRLELEHVASGSRFETSILKERVPKSVASVWLRQSDDDMVELSYFDPSKFEPCIVPLKRFTARKSGRMGDWEPFESWFSPL